MALGAAAVPAFAAADSASTVQEAPNAAGGLIPQRLVWPGIAVIVVIAVFATAALAGPLIRANSDDGPETGTGTKPSDHVQ